MPRKSDTGPGAKDGGNGALSNATATTEVTKDGGGGSIEDNTLPKSLVLRLIKGVLPQNTNVQKDAQLAITKGATVFINHLVDEANQIALKANRKTITPKDIMEAITQCELDEFRPRLGAELAKFEAIQSEKRATHKQNAKVKEVVKETAATGEGDTNAEGDVEEEGDSPPPAKKRKSMGPSIMNGGMRVKKALTSKKNTPVSAPEPVDNTDEDEIIGPEDADLETEDEDEIEEESKIEPFEEVIEDLDEGEPLKDEALDTGDDSD